MLKGNVNKKANKHENERYIVYPVLLFSKCVKSKSKVAMSLSM